LIFENFESKSAAGRISYIVMNTNNLKMRFCRLAGIFDALLFRSQPRWLVWLVGVVALVVVVRIILIASQILNIFNESYVAGLT
jgi:phosphotransferase system  glucose/maltose/N-acetylglucosamine-specific IIC component